MNYQELIEAISKTPRDWFFLAHTGRIRRNHISNDGITFQCPVTSLVNMHSGQLVLASIILDLDDQIAEEVARAADDSVTMNLEIRKDLLEACGLPERIKLVDRLMEKEELVAV